MPVGVAPSDKKLLSLGGGLLLLMLLTSVVLAPPAEQNQSKIPSTYSAQSAGAQAAYRLLSALHYPVRRWQSPPTELNVDNDNILLILAEPSQPPSANERKALEDFVRNGGHVLFTGGDIQSYFPSGSISQEYAAPSWQTFTPNLPSTYTRGVPKITLQPQAYWGKLQSQQLALYGDKNAPVVVSWRLDEGHISWWAGSTPLTNAGITEENNLQFFLNAVVNWDGDEPYQIYWDEYFHGERSSLWSYVAKTSIAWGALQIAILVAAVLFTFARRSGPIFIPSELSRLSPLEFVDTLGGLYERANAGSAAVAVSLQRFRTLITRQLVLPSNTPAAALAAAAEQRLGWRDKNLQDTLLSAEAATRQEKVASHTALKLVRTLETFSARLDMRSQLIMEKK
jgi:Domain of unknown function (DUF4350)